MAITAAAGPLSNILLSVVFAGLLRVELLVIERLYNRELLSVINMVINGTGADLSPTFKLLAVLAYMLYMGVVLNISLAVFNLIPIPPFDGSRIFYTFLPVNLYFKIMRYERYIMIAILVLLWATPLFDGLISGATSGLASLITSIFGISKQSSALNTLNAVLIYIQMAF